MTRKASRDILRGLPTRTYFQASIETVYKPITSFQDTGFPKNEFSKTRIFQKEFSFLNHHRFILIQNFPFQDRTLTVLHGGTLLERAAEVGRRLVLLRMRLLSHRVQKYYRIEANMGRKSHCSTTFSAVSVHTVGVTF